MVAAVTVTKGSAEMAYVGEKPWHGLGQNLTAGAPIETWTKEAGMAWKVQRSKVRYATGKDDAGMREWESQHVFFRSDTKAPLGLGSESFQLVQPGECLEFFRDLVADKGMTLETAGTLFGGKRYWAMARTNYDAEVGKGDHVRGYLLLATACDGSMATTAKFTGVRVVCNNTLTAALGGTGEAIRVRHSSVFNETQVKIDLGVVEKSWDVFARQLKTMSRVKLARTDAEDVLVEALGDPVEFVTAGRDLASQPRAITSILSLYDGAAIGAQLPGVASTGWGLVNATTQYFDHAYGRDPSRRLTKAWFGKNDAAKTRVAEAVLKMAA